MTDNINFQCCKGNVQILQLILQFMFLDNFSRVQCFFFKYVVWNILKSSQHIRTPVGPFKRQFHFIEIPLGQIRSDPFISNMMIPPNLCHRFEITIQRIFPFNYTSNRTLKRSTYANLLKLTFFDSTLHILQYNQQIC